MTSCPAPCPATSHTWSAYRAGICRCAGPREIQRLYNKRRHEGRAPVMRYPVIGYRRRLRALQFNAWPLAVLGEQAGIPYESLCNVLRARQHWINRGTAQIIRNLYGKFDQLEGPSTIDRYGTASTEWQAWRRGYAPPTAWLGQDIDDPLAIAARWRGSDRVDVVEVERVAYGQARYHDLATEEAKRLAFRLAVAAGVSHRRIHDEWHIGDATIKRLRTGRDG